MTTNNGRTVKKPPRPPGRADGTAGRRDTTPPLPPDWLLVKRGEALHHLLTHSFRNRCPVGALQTVVAGLRALESISKSDTAEATAVRVREALARAADARTRRGPLNRVVACVVMMSAARSLAVEFSPQEWEVWGAAPGSSRAAATANAVRQLAHAAGAPAASSADLAALFWATALVGLFAPDVLHLVDQPAGFADYAREVLAAVRGESVGAGAGQLSDYLRDVSAVPPPAAPRPLSGGGRVRLALGGNHGRMTPVAWGTTAALAVSLALAAVGWWWQSRAAAASDAFTRDFITPHLTALGVPEPAAK